MHYKYKLTKCACGEVYRRTGRQPGSELCPRCRLPRKLARRDERLGMRSSAFAIRIVNDPLEPGGFRPGTVFQRQEVAGMIGANALTPKTIVQDMRGREYVYQGGSLFEPTGGA